MGLRRAYDLGPTELAYADEIANAIRRLVNDNPNHPMTVRALVAALGIEVKTIPMANPGDVAWVKGRWVISIAEDLAPARESVVLGHELDHWWFLHRDEAEPPYKEELADAVGARLAMPESIFREAVEYFDHRVKALAGHFTTTRKGALLRTSEITGRPGMAKCKGGGWIARGGAFEWAEDWRLIPRAKAHYVPLDDTWGMLAERDEWRRAD